MRMAVRVGETAMMMLLSSSSSYLRSRSVVGDSDGIVLDGDNDDDVVGDNDVGSSVDVGSVDGGDDPHGLRFFRCHCRGDGSFSGVAIMMFAVVVAAALSSSLSLLLSFLSLSRALSISV